MRQVVKILPNRALYRENLALYEDYAGEFAVAEQQVRGMQDPGVFALVALSFAELGQERLPEAEDTYQSIAKVDHTVIEIAAEEPVRHHLAKIASWWRRPQDIDRMAL